MPPTHDVTLARSERPLYEDLLGRLTLLALPVVQQHLEEVTAANATALLREQVLQLRAFLLEADDADEPGAAQRLGRHLDDLADQPVAPDESKAELAAQAARSLAGAWLRHLRRSATERQVTPRSLLPVADEDTDDWAAVLLAVAPYGVSRPGLEQILRGLLQQWLESWPATASTVPLPQQLVLSRQDVERALGNRPFNDTTSSGDKAFGQPYFKDVWNSLKETLRLNG